MALPIDQIRALAERIAAMHSLEIVDIEFSGGAKHRTLRVFIEKNAEARAKLVELAKSAESGAPLDPTEHIPDLPSGVAPELLSGVTHEDCVLFNADFSVQLDIEDIVPGAEYTLEVSSPGLERKLSRPADYERFTGSLIKLQTFTAIAVDGPGTPAKRQFEARLTAFQNNTATLDLSAIKPKGKPKKTAVATTHVIEIPFTNIEKANLITEL